METKYDDCPKELRDFLFYTLTIRGRSARTVDAYHIDLRTFLRYIRLTKDSSMADMPLEKITIDVIPFSTIASITLSDVYGFLNYVISNRDNNSQTRSRKVSSIRSFFKYLTNTAHLIEENPVRDLEMPSIKKSLPKYLTLEESLELISSVETQFPQRDACIITLFLNCGMRLSELVSINLEDIRNNSLKLLGKGNKERIVYLNDACLHAIKEYLKVRKPSPSTKDKNALFLSKRNTRLTPRRVEQIVADCLKRAGLGGLGYSPHKLRHTAATLMYQHGNVDIRVLKEILGHSNLATTEIYTHVANSQVEDAAMRSPLANVMIKPKKRSAGSRPPTEDKTKED